MYEAVVVVAVTVGVELSSKMLTEVVMVGRTKVEEMTGNSR